MPSLNKYLLLLLLLISAEFSYSQKPPATSAVFDFEQEDWYYRKKDDNRKFALTGKWPEAYMGTVHMLDPVKKFNCDSLQWMEKAEWVYETKIKTGTVGYENYTLTSGDMEPYSEIRVNDHLIGKNNNYFLKKHFNITGKIKPGKGNKIEVTLFSTVEKAKAQYAPGKLIYPSDSDTSKTCQFIRKPAFLFGWDFSPRLMIPSFSKKIKITGWNDFFIHQHWVKQDTVNEKEGRLFVYFEIESSAERMIEISCNHSPYEKNDKAMQVTLKKGKQLICVPVIIRNPKLWWPNGLYQQIHPEKITPGPHLYSLEFSFVSQRQTERVNITTGLRNIKLIQKKDSFGESFYFEINGRKVFIKGANIVPEIHSSGTDVLLSRFSSSQSPVINFNMFRIWGGGEYMSEKFYDYCDENGILVWQDFMFANTMYPSDSVFLSNVKEEAEFQVKRLSSHPCIALWCGNNEIEVAWKNWGWQKKYKYTKEQEKELEHGYDTLFNRLLPAAVSSFSNHTNYLSSSPVSNWGKPEDFSKGDNHYWGVWHGEHQIEVFNSRVPRFMSEFGFPSFPLTETITNYITEITDTTRENEIEFQYRMKSYKGIKLLREYISHVYGEPVDFLSLVYLSHTMQADAYKTAIEAHRRAKPYCMGTLFWQLNDAWPGITWSTVDYSGNFKAAHYEILNAYRPLIISPVKDADTVKVYIVSDFIKDTTVDIEIKVMDFYGKNIFELSKEIKIHRDTSMIVFSSPENTLLKNYPVNKILLYCRVYKKKIPWPANVHDNILYFVSPRELDLPKPPEITKINRGLSYTSPVLIKNIDLSYYSVRTKTLGDILPGEKVLFYEDRSGYATGKSLYHFVKKKSTEE